MSTLAALLVFFLKDGPQGGKKVLSSHTTPPLLPLAPSAGVSMRGLVGILLCLSLLECMVSSSSPVHVGLGVGFDLPSWQFGWMPRSPLFRCVSVVLGSHSRGPPVCFQGVGGVGGFSSGKLFQQLVFPPLDLVCSTSIYSHGQPW
jgi:hypothetical protein